MKKTGNIRLLWIAYTKIVLPAKANLQAGDIILSMDGETINRVFDVIYHVRQKKAGDTCQIEVLRGQEKMTVGVTFFESKRD